MSEGFLFWHACKPKAANGHAQNRERQFSVSFQTAPRLASLLRSQGRGPTSPVLLCAYTQESQAIKYCRCLAQGLVVHMVICRQVKQSCCACSLIYA